HTLKPSDIYKLDSKYRDKPERGTLEFDGGTVRVKTNTSTRDYPTPQSIEAPLTVYIRILVTHSAPTGKASDLRSDYEWSAVLAYHMAFFPRRRREMASGSYVGWKTMDSELQGEFLVGFRKVRAPVASPRKAQSG
ncbi:hypothetical protein B0H17DRAFT_897508, partial [Mycena rosella]